MWIFLPLGLIMPVVTEAHDKADPAHTLNGQRELQVRGRLTEHLNQFIADFMDPHGLDHSVVVETPDHDYTCRFYTTKEAFAVALGHAVMDIDYRHFKEQAERKDKATGGFRYKLARHYHNCLIGLWSESLKIAPAGGFYGAWSTKNPNGYKGRNRWSGKSSYDYGDVTFGSDDLAQYSPAYTQDELEGFTPNSELRAADLFEEVEYLPVADWEDYFSGDDLKLVIDYVTKYADTYPEHIKALRTYQETKDMLRKPRRRRNNRRKSKV